jgi:hypothetical protein
MRKVVDTGVDRNLENRAKAYVDRVGAELE